jgi:hypothetical protein
MQGNMIDVSELPETINKWNKFLSKHSFSEQWLWQYWKNDSRPQNQLNKKIMNHFDSKLKAQKEVKKLIRQGIPSCYRGAVWWAASGACNKMAAEEGLHSYASYTQQGDNVGNPSLIDIEKDINRTFLVRDTENSEEAIQALRRLLIAYSVRNRQIGYCQSMNFIAALLLIIMEEEQAFWVLAAIIEDILPNNYYSSSMIGCRVDQRVFFYLYN